MEKKELEEKLLKIINGLVDKYPEDITEIKRKSTGEVNLSVSPVYSIIIRPKNDDNATEWYLEPWEIVFLIQETNSLYANLTVDVSYCHRSELSDILNKIYLLRVERRFNSLYKKYASE